MSGQDVRNRSTELLTPQRYTAENRRYCERLFAEVVNR
jgi:hypothetical protein